MAKSKKPVERSVEAVQRTVDSLGDYVREQRLNARLSLRQLAELTGVSNPYLSQIERGLRRPSAEVLQQLAKALRVSSQQLYVRAGLISPDEPGAGSVELAVLRDPTLTERQKQTLLDVYASFQALNGQTNEPPVRGGSDRGTERGSVHDGHHQEGQHQD